MYCVNNALKLKKKYYLFYYIKQQKQYLKTYKELYIHNLKD